MIEPERPTPMLIVISAPSGGGKTTLCQQLLARHPEMTRAVTCTTRAPRLGEEEGRDYFFLDDAEFTRRVEAGAFLEHARVHERSYGTPKAEVLDKLRQGQDVLLNIDVQGAATVRSRAEADADLRDALITVFLTPATMAELELRLRRRATDSAEELERRLEAARHEVTHWRTFQYLIISPSIEEDVRRMEAILEAERMRQGRAHFTIG